MEASPEEQSYRDRNTGQRCLCRQDGVEWLVRDAAGNETRYTQASFEQRFEPLHEDMPPRGTT
jgi:hypothetical protein